MNFVAFTLYACNVNYAIGLPSYARSISRYSREPVSKYTCVTLVYSVVVNSRLGRGQSQARAIDILERHGASVGAIPRLAA